MRKIATLFPSIPLWCGCIVLIALFVISPSTTVFAAGARWIPTPSIWNPIADSFATAWSTEIYATCKDVTIVVGSSLDEFPQEGNEFYPYKYFKVSWYLVNVFDQQRSPVALDAGAGPHLIAEFLAEDSVGLEEQVVKDKTFALAEPVEAGKRLFASVRVDFTYDNLEEAGEVLVTETFQTIDLGDFNDTFDFIRADGLGYTEFGQHSYFCNSGHERSAPTISLTGNGIGLEGDGGTAFAPFYLSLSHPTDKPVDVEFYITGYNGLDDHGVNIPNYSKPVCSGRSTPGTVYQCPRGPEGSQGIEEFTVVTIPAGEVSAVVNVTFGGNTQPNGFIGYTGGIYRATNAHISPSQNSGDFVRVDDDGCLDPQPDYINDPNAYCRVMMGVPNGSGGSIGNEIGKGFEFYVTSNASVINGLPTLNEGAGTATFTVHLDRVNATSENMTVDYAVVDGTTTGDDYATASGTLTFIPGDATETFELAITNDASAENLEYFKVVLSNPTGNGASVPSGGDFTFWLTDDEQTFDLLANGGFEIASGDIKVADGWAGLADGKARRRCNLVNRPNNKPDQLFAWYGDCAYQFNTSYRAVQQGVKSALVGDAVPQIGDKLTLSAWFETVNLTQGATFNATIYYQGGTTKVINFAGKVGTNAYAKRSKTVTITKAVKKIVVRVSTGSATGILRVDDVALTLIRPTVAETLAGAGIVPLPSAPSDLRGSN